MAINHHFSTVKVLILCLITMSPPGRCFPPSSGLDPQLREKVLRIVDQALASSELRDDPQVRTLRQRVAQFSRAGGKSGRFVDFGNILQLLGVGFEMGGSNGPAISMNSPLGRVGCGFVDATRRPSPSLDEVDDLRGEAWVSSIKNEKKKITFVEVTFQICMLVLHNKRKRSDF